MKRFIYIASFFIFCPLIALSQYYIKGQVRDETGKYLQNVSLFLHSTSYLYYSGSEGAFGIPSSKRIDTLTVSMEGYQKQRILVDAQKPVQIILHRSSLTMISQVNRLASLTQNLGREAQQQWFSGDETYASTIENQFIAAAAYPTTGMSLNVDRASYSNIRRFLNMDAVVPPDAVRLEELLNYFNFGYTEPAAGKNFEIRTVLTQCPWNKESYLLFAQVFSKKLSFDSLPPSHLVFLIDVSGSMDTPNRLPLLKSGFKTLVHNLRAVDSVAIVVYGGSVGIPLPTTGGDQKERILRVIDSLQASGATPGESGIKLAYSVAKNHFIPGGNNRIILATDGDFNVGLRTEKELEEMIMAQRDKGIYLTCLGMGMGNYKDSKIQALAKKGNGNFAYLDSYSEAEKVLLKEFTQTLYTVADDAYLNVRFNPAYVKEYRLIGFENKVGAIKDTSSTIEGGEIGSAYTSMVAFEIVPSAPLPPGTPLDLSSFTLNYKLPGSKEFLQLTEDHQVNLTPFQSLQRCHQFAASVIMFGSLLRNSRYVKNITWNDILKIATTAVDENNYAQREFLTSVQHARNVYGKKRKKSRDED